MIIWDEGTPRCAEPDVDPTWWHEPDLAPEDFPEGKRAHGGRYDESTEYGAALAEARENQLRAKFFCYECPLLWACRKAGWDEPAHVWGGLDATERWRARRGKRLPHAGRNTARPNRMRELAQTMFVGGDSIYATATSLRLDTSSVTYYLNVALAQARATREKETTWVQNACPPAPAGMDYETFRAGAAISGRWREASACS